MQRTKCIWPQGGHSRISPAILLVAKRQVAILYSAIRTAGSCGAPPAPLDSSRPAAATPGRGGVVVRPIALVVYPLLAYKLLHRGSFGTRTRAPSGRAAPLVGFSAAVAPTQFLTATASWRVTVRRRKAAFYWSRGSLLHWSRRLAQFCPNALGSKCISRHISIKMHLGPSAFGPRGAIPIFHLPFCW